MATDIVERLRAMAGPVVPNVCTEAADEIERLLLTHDERMAISEACDEGRWFPKDYHYIHTLRGLLERTR